MENVIENYFDLLNQTTNLINKNEIFDISYEIIKRIDNSNYIYLCGNGGSAFAASHYVTDWNKFLLTQNQIKLKATSLNDNFGILTAYANDLSYENIFKKQLETLLTKDDLLICLIGSGNSQNLINAVSFANSIGATTISILGFDGGKLLDISKKRIHIKVNDMQVYEDLQISVGHIILKILLDKYK